MKDCEIANILYNLSTDMDADTYQFNYSSSVDGFGTIQFCSYTKKEATDLFESWQAENGYNIPEYTVQTVYNRADAEEYGAEYFVK